MSTIQMLQYRFRKNLYENNLFLDYFQKKLNLNLFPYMLGDSINHLGGMV